ncbi:MAG: DUF6009 family protein [Thiobacillaceae bacterium]|nr:DUF6009 family protein [Thiobacillaceae bacterium]
MDASALAGEERIIWLADIAVLDYVRQTIFLTHRRRGKPAGWRIGRLVGYAAAPDTSSPGGSST